MMVKQIIPADHHLTRKEFQKDGDNFLHVSEFYFDTIQGEGIHIGVPAAFLRLQGCPLGCSYCDTTEVWRYGTPWTFDELIRLIDAAGLNTKLLNGHHLVITGGSPLQQQERLYNFIKAFESYFGFLPFIEIENECTILPKTYFANLIACWNNSPKLESSGVKFEDRYKPDVIQVTANNPRSWFKFVISKEEDWDEIETGFLMPGLIGIRQIILMPEGATREELERNRELTVELAVQHGVRYSTREHIVLWNKKIGV